jgi:MarR family transcriptional regulator, organic hydroperoxide resistance regulator
MRPTSERRRNATGGDRQSGGRHASDDASDRKVTEFDAFAAGLTAFFRAARRVPGQVGEAGSCPLSLSQFIVLDSVEEHGEASVGELARSAGVSVPTVTRMLDGLVRDGIVDRRRVDHDRRLVRVTLTPAGHELMREKRGWVRERQHEVYAGLPAADRRRLGPLLQRLARLMDQLSDDLAPRRDAA